ncbi:phBC6A51 family helix-turn-helix protein [Planococcus maritimus]|nr:phBC6A51 family helix-turn-helix protein [Planococcus sp. SK3692]MDE4086192.1 phBC6A51 family helix-turn-helix protein [Planococcus maritimus]
MANYNDRTLENLNGQGVYSTNMQVAAELLALPSRGGFSLKEVAVKAEISERQLRNWRQDGRFQALVEKKTRTNVKEIMPDVFASIIDRAVNEGSAKHAELLLKYQGLLTEKHEFTSVHDQYPRKDLNQFDEVDNAIETEIAELRSLIDQHK